MNNPLKGLLSKRQSKAREEAENTIDLSKLVGRHSTDTKSKILIDGEEYHLSNMTVRREGDGGQWSYKKYELTIVSEIFINELNKKLYNKDIAQTVHNNPKFDKLALELSKQKEPEKLSYCGKGCKIHKGQNHNHAEKTPTSDI